MLANQLISCHLRDLSFPLYAVLASSGHSAFSAELLTELITLHLLPLLFRHLLTLASIHPAPCLLNTEASLLFSSGLPPVYCVPVEAWLDRNHRCVQLTFRPRDISITTIRMFARRPSHQSDSFSKHRATKSITKTKRSFRDAAPSSSSRRVEKPKKPEGSPPVGRFVSCHLSLPYSYRCHPSSPFDSAQILG